jgi:anti-sigma factor RsiW
MKRSIELELMRLLHGELPPAEAAALRTRLDREADLAAAYRRLEHTWEALAPPLEVGVPPGFAARIMARASAVPRPGSLSWGAAPGWVRAAAAAALLAGAAVGAGVGGRVHLGSHRSAAAPPDETLATYAALQPDSTDSLTESYWSDLAEATEEEASPAPPSTAEVEQP